MGSPSSTLRKKKSKESGRMGTSSSSSRIRKQEIITEAEADPIETSASSSQVNKMEPSKISSLIDGSLVYDREDDKKKITQLLLSDNCKYSNVNINCIVGANGIGKTTMVQLIYADKRIENAFDARIFISMYENFDEKRLMKVILESLTCVSCDITEPSILEEIVKDELRGKKLLLVLDNAENENKSFWDFLMVLLSVTSKGSAVLVTTSTWKVANIIGAIHCYHLGYLSDTVCWLIFKQLAFRGTDPNAQTELGKIGKHLITKCSCNMLCIKMLGGLLSRTSMGAWKSILECDSWDTDKSGGKVLPVLLVCYEFLPSPLKQCFAYCSLFPKGYIFSKDHLVRLWLSQGFIEPVVGSDLEDIGIQWFEELCDISFFHHSPLHNTRDDKFIMHELIHDLAQYVSINECFRSEDCMHVIPKGVRHFSLIPSEYQTVALSHIIAKTKDLKSFLVTNRFMFEQDSTLSSIIYLVGLSDVFAKLISLRVLDLSNTDLEELPHSIGLLRNLYYLGLNNTKIRSIPQEIGNLINLRTLEAKGCYNLVELPNSIEELAEIRHLDVSKEAGFVGMPVGIGKMINLRSLATFNVGSDEIHCGIEELKHLDNLKGCLRINGLENVTNGLDAKSANIKSKGCLESVSLQWRENTGLIDKDEDIELHEKILENLQPSENLQELVIRNYVGNQFPLWIEDPCFTILVSIILDGCPNCSKLPMLGTLPALRYLSVQRLYGVDAMEVSNFPCLEVLNLWEMCDLKEWPEIENGDFPRLRILSISRCPRLQSIPRFPSLVELSFHCCSQLPKFPELHSLETLKIEGLLKAKCLKLPPNLIALKKLEISHCNELSSLEGLSTSIEVIKVIECPKLDVDNWKPNPFKSNDTSKKEFEEVDDCGISETKNTRPKDLPIMDIQLKNEIEEILAKQKLEKDILKQFVERLMHEIETLESWREGKLTNEKKLELEQLLSFCKQGTKDLEVSLEVSRGHLESLQIDCMSFWLKGDHVVKEADDVPHIQKHFTFSASKSLITVFSKKEMKEATQNFSNSLKIGQDGYRSMYRGFLGKTTVAIKKFEALAPQELKQEVDILSRLTHPNIVNLMGVCYDPPCIIYEYLLNGSLDRFLYGTNNTPPLSWQVCTRIIAEICSALIHIQSNKPPIIHRDLKPSNILLDANLVSKLTDFGISRSFASSTDDHVSTVVKGTLGYLDPEYLRTGQLTLKSDIYTFGVSILEIVTQQKACEIRDGEPFRVKESVEQAIISGGLSLLKVAGEWPLEQAKTLLQLGIRCSDPDSSKRPDLVTEIWPVIRSALRVASLSVPHSDQFSIKTMQGPNSSQMFQVAGLKEEIEEILVRENHEKDVIEEHIEQLRQDMKLLERQQDGKYSKLGGVQHASSSFGGSTKYIEVEEAEMVNKEREDVSGVSYLPSVTEFSFQEPEAVDNSDISETKNTGPKDLPITDIQLKNKVEEILAKEKLEKEILKEYVERLMQEVQILERVHQRKYKYTDEKKLELEQLLSFCKRSTKDLEFSLEVARGRLDSLETDYRSLWLKEDHAVKKAQDVPHLKELLTATTSKSFISIFSKKEVKKTTNNFSVFSKKEVKKATKNFSDFLKIGQGGFGCVYRGFLEKTKTTVAIKKLSETSHQGSLEFKREVDVLSRVRHPNIINLMGVCYDPLCIITEYVPNGSLDNFLNGTNNTPALSWQVRTRIIAEICSALIYLHSNEPPVVHRDIKPANFLLDANFVSKLTDFGISIFAISTDDHVSTRVMGTFGYVDPEYMRTGQLTVKSDIHAFGISILEIVTGKRAFERRDEGTFGMREEVEKALISGGLPLLNPAGEWPPEQAKTLLQLGLRCSDLDGNKRPDLVTKVWPVIRSALRAASLSVPHSDQFSIMTMQGPNSSQIFQVAELKEVIEELLVREKHEKDVIEEQIAELTQKMKLLGRQQDGIYSKLGVVQHASSSSGGATKDIEVEEAKKLKKDREDVSVLPSVTEFSFQELKAATQNFSDALKIGEGGSGPVYRGSLLKTTVAIKTLRCPTERGQSEFQQEVAILSRVRHPHLVTLLGVCSEPCCLIYEYLPNGSLEDRLTCANNTSPLPWQIRTRIIGEICSALMFLHSTNPHLVIHGDLKPSNILLDANLVCKLSDFGISHLIEEFHTTTTAVFYYTQPKGTFAYMDPEFASTGKLTAQSDIYAFGIIILRLVTGKPPLGITRVVEEALEEGKLPTLIDAPAGEWPFEQALVLAKLGLSCASLHRRMRPDLVSEVWATIEPLLKDASTS